MRTIQTARTNQQLDDFRTLCREYADWLGIDLCFQNFDAEMASLPGKYAPPEGEIYLAYWNERLAGCAAFYPMEPGICEIKRLFVRDAFKGKGIGRALFEQAMQDAKMRGYEFMRLDSLKRLKAAASLYQALGFREVEPYNVNPQEDVYYMERAL